ncbi:MAG: hypothetical protein EUB_02386 [Eubacterium sp.]|uniref:PssE/Cps14G family polysaccharide biosynthesis glycosyltransferase n=1 Tax=Eubacterium sp. TaxID=142586 RepID=UPI003024FF82
MIFVCLGTQIFQFDRLTKKLDELVESGVIKEDIFAQIGAAEYLPQHYHYEQFIDKDKFAELQDKADLIIAHGGTGALVSASKKGKNIIAVPRLAKFGEHVDDHQLQVVDVLEKEGYVRAVYDMVNLGKEITEALEYPIKKPYQRESNIIPIIIDYIESI